jgi:hypothetical protein
MKKSHDAKLRRQIYAHLRMMGGETTDNAASYNTSLRGSVHGKAQHSTIYAPGRYPLYWVPGLPRHLSYMIWPTSYLPTINRRLAVLHLIICFALVSCTTTEDVWKWTCERLALILRTAPQHVPPERLGAPTFSFQPNPIITLCYGSSTTRLITRSKSDSDHSHRL